MVKQECHVCEGSGNCGICGIIMKKNKLKIFCLASSGGENKQEQYVHIDLVEDIKVNKRELT